VPQGASVGVAADQGLHGAWLDDARAPAIVGALDVHDGRPEPGRLLQLRQAGRRLGEVRVRHDQVVDAGGSRKLRLEGLDPVEDGERRRARGRQRQVEMVQIRDGLVVARPRRLVLEAERVAARAQRLRRHATGQRGVDLAGEARFPDEDAVDPCVHDVGVRRVAEQPDPYRHCAARTGRETGKVERARLGHHHAYGQLPSPDTSQSQSHGSLSRGASNAR